MLWLTGNLPTFDTTQTSTVVSWKAMKLEMATGNEQYSLQKTATAVLENSEILIF